MTELLTVCETAAKLRVSNATIYRLLNARQIPGAFRLGEFGAWRVPEDSLVEWMREQARDRVHTGKRRSGY